MPSSDIDAMLHDVSNQMAKSQLFRRMSAKSNNSSPGSRKGNTRVAKPHSSGGTPLGVQRRRTTAAYSNRSKATAAQSFASVQQPPQAATAVPQRLRPSGTQATVRPVTWHPGSYHLDRCPQDSPYDSGLPFYSSAASQGTPQTIDYLNYFSHSTYASPLPSESYGRELSSNQYSQQSTPDHYFDCTHNNSVFQPSLYNYSTLFANQDTTPLSTYDQYPTSSQLNYPCQVPTDYPIYPTQDTSSLFSSQSACDPPQYQNPEPLQITKQRSKELVGMGLYDGPSRKELSTPDTSADRISMLLAAPQGKGLKLEETWQPPNEDADDDDDEEEEEEDSSADEAEEDLPPAPAQTIVQPNAFQTYGDLSNQSFFFESDDPYTNCMSFDQGIQVYPPKASEPSLQNFMWF
ncbi:MAG: hypothetical protein Q9170_004754 [Blastenia crenularia]